jgi:nitrate reductase gamma subunit
MRLSDDELRAYSNPSHVLNLVLFIAVLGFALGAWGFTGWRVAPLRDFVASLATLQVDAAVDRPLAITIVAGSLLLAYVPLTHMSHFFVKWFTWHRIRWDDEPNVRGGRIERMIADALERPVTWSAPHIAGDGRKTWADVAAEELKPTEEPTQP